MVNRVSLPVHCAVANKSYTKIHALTFITYSFFSFWCLSIHFLKPLNTPLNSLMYFQQKVWELGEWIPDVHDCKLKWSLCPYSWSNIPKHLMLECYNKTLTCSTYSRPIGVISDSLCASSCSLHPSCHLVTLSLKELSNVSHLMSHISQGHTGAIWVTANNYFKIFQSHNSLYFLKRNILYQHIHRCIFCLKCDRLNTRSV